MPQYLVKAPCAYINADGTATAHSAAAVDVAVVEVPAEAAKALGPTVLQPLDTADTANPAPFTAPRGKHKVADEDV